MKKTRKNSYLKNKRRIVILICLIILVIFEIVALRNSKASKVIEILADVEDETKELEVQEIDIEAVDSGASGYYIILPEYVNNKRVGNYVVEEKNIEEKTGKSQESNKDENELYKNAEAELAINNETVTDTNNVEENIINNNIEGNIINNNVENIETLNIQTENTINETQENIALENKNTGSTNKEILKVPGEKIFLTDNELNEKKITLRAIFNSYTKNDEILYEQIIEKQIDDNNDGNVDTNIRIEGYMPLNSSVEATPVEIDDIQESIGNILSDKISFKNDNIIITDINEKNMNQQILTQM